MDSLGTTSAWKIRRNVSMVYDLQNSNQIWIRQHYKRYYKPTPCVLVTLSFSFQPILGLSSNSNILVSMTAASEILLSYLLDLLWQLSYYASVFPSWLRLQATLTFARFDMFNCTTVALCPYNSSCSLSSFLFWFPFFISVPSKILLFTFPSNGPSLAYILFVRS